VLVHAPTPQDEAPRQRPATYGALLDATCEAVRTAVLRPHEQPLPPGPAHAEILGYRRFLRTCGLHLGLLGRFQPELTPDQRHLLGRLASLPIEEAEPSAWLGAARSLGAAHDLLATHLDTSQLPRTPEAEERLTPIAVLVPTRDVTALVLEAVTAGTDLVQSAIESQKNLLDQPIPYPLLRGTRERTASLRPFAKAAHSDASRVASEGCTSALSSLQPAPITSRDQNARTAFTTQLEALRTLRQLTFAQAHGQIAASPMSLRDLALLGAAVTTPDVSWLPAPQTGLERLAHAQARDVLQAAHASWAAAAEDLTQTVLGTTRAPRLYGDAITCVRNPKSHSPSVRLAFLSALPRLGRDAAGAVDRLQSQNALVAKTRQPLLLATVWRPISPADARDLSRRFSNAATNSEAAAVTVRRILTPATTKSASAHPAHPAPRREVALTRSAQR
jgi:hypothetical protein